MTKSVGPKVHDRKTRRGMKKRMREHHNTINKAVLIACRIFEDAALAKDWVLTPNDYFFGRSPLETILLGDGAAVLELLEERNPEKAEASIKALTDFIKKPLEQKCDKQ